MIEIWVPGKLPTENEMLDARGRIAFAGRSSKRWNKYAELKRQADALVMLHARLHEPVTWPVHVTCAWNQPTRRLDPDNVAAGIKFVMDGLVLARVLPADGARWIRKIEHQFLYPGDKGYRGPGVLITLRRWEPKEVKDEPARK